MNYEVVLSKEAKADLYAIYRYIAIDLVATETAHKQVNRLQEGMQALSFLPEKYRIYNAEKWPNLRMTMVDQYSVFYEVSKHTHQVCIVRILYGRRNFDDILEEPY